MNYLERDTSRKLPLQIWDCNPYVSVWGHLWFAPKNKLRRTLDRIQDSCEKTDSIFDKRNLLYQDFNGIADALFCLDEIPVHNLIPETVIISILMRIWQLYYITRFPRIHSGHSVVSEAAGTA